MPDPSPGHWRGLVQQRSAAAGYPLSGAVLDELAAHIAEVYADERDRGASHEDAVRAASAVLDRASYDELAACGRAATREPDPADGPRSSSLGGLGFDLRDAWRTVSRQPAFSIAVAVILAVGIGASTAAYVVIDTVLLRALPYPDAARLITLRRVSPESEGRAFATADWSDHRSRSAGIVDLAAFASWPMNVTGGGEPERLRSVIVSGNFFEVLGRPAALGRTIGSADDDAAAARVAVLSDGFWRRRMGGAPSAIGSGIVLNGRPATVIGVMPPGFAIPDGNVDLWMPMGLPAEVLSDRASEWVSVIGRLRPGVDLAAAQAALSVTAQALAQAYPRTNAGERARAQTLHDELVGGAVRPLWLGGLAALLVLLASCGNAANLLIGRAARRRQEIAIRAGLGAQPRRLVRQLLMESTLQTGLGAALGAAAAAAFLRGFAALGDGRVPRLDELALSPAPVAAAVTASMLVAVAFAAAANWFIVRSALTGAPAAGSRVTARQDGRWLLSGQVAFAWTLLTASMMVAGSYAATMRIDPGFDPDDTLTLQLTLPRSRYPDAAAHVRFVERLTAEVGATGGVTSVGIVSDLPFVANALHFRIGAGGATPESGEQMTVRPADPGFFATLRIPVVEGRVFTAGDRADAPQVAIVNATAARRLAEAAPVGGRLQVAGEPPRTLVGIVGDIRHGGLHDEEGPVVYVPDAQKTFDFVNWMGVVVRGPGIERAAPAVRLAVHRIDADQPVQAVRTMADYVSGERAPFEFGSLVIGTLAGAAILLAAAGIYSMTAVIVGRRRRELGIRRALGASNASLLWLVLRRAGVPVIAGAVPGIAGSAIGAGVLRGTLAADVAPAALPAVLLSAGLMLAAALASALGPAWRATGVDPKVALEDD